jgi:RNase P subunit RPR2
MRRKRKPEREQHWQGMSEEMMMLIGMKDWRQQHPKATFREIEEAVDERLTKLRAQMLEDVVRMSPETDWSQVSQEQRPKCLHCGTPLVARGKQMRRLQTSGGQEVKMERSYGTCAQCGQGIFPPG